jgi:hypothetical protein
MGNHGTLIDDLDPTLSKHLLNRTEDSDVNLGASIDHSDHAVDSDAHTLRIPYSVDAPSGDIEDLWDQDNIQLDDLKLSIEFIRHLWDSGVANSTLGLSQDAVNRLCNPPCAHPGLGIDMDMRLEINLYFENPSEILYKRNCVIFIQ